MERTFLFPTLTEVLTIHADQVARYGGSEGLRDEGLLSSALAQPEAEFGGRLLHPSIGAQAAAFLFHLVKNHPFADGNKRLGTATALVFLEINGYELDPALDDIDSATGQTALETAVIRVASSRMSKDDLIRFLESHVRQCASLNPS